MTLFEQYKKGRIDLSAFGLERRADRGGYFCDPIGARAFAWTGVDGIHYSVIRDFGDMIFMICPDALPGEYVRPVAHDFTDFLRLLLAFGDEAAVENASTLPEKRFASFLRENPPSEMQSAAIRAITETWQLTPMDEPYRYIRQVQAAFDYSQIRFRREYAEWVPPETAVPAASDWKVYFDGSFFGHSGRARPGTEIPVGRTFFWGEREIRVPAVYVCTAGVVIDFCCSADMQDMWQYFGAYERLSAQPMDEETEERLRAEHPLNLDFRARLLVNGEELAQSGGCALTYIPETLTGETPDMESRFVIRHYGLDESECWGVTRVRFAWENKRKIHALSVTLSQRMTDVCVGHLETPGTAEAVFVHPITQEKYTLTVTEQECASIDRGGMRSGGMELPGEHVRLCYTLSPDLPSGAFCLRDCAASDEPRPVCDARESGADFGIIGGADGPVAVFVGVSHGGHVRGEGVHIALSAMHFAQPSSVRWRAVFRVKTLADVTAELL